MGNCSSALNRDGEGGVGGTPEEGGAAAGQRELLVDVGGNRGNAAVGSHGVGVAVSTVGSPGGSVAAVRRLAGRVDSPQNHPDRGADDVGRCLPDLLRA